MKDLITSLRKIEKEMEAFVSPKNEHGFRRIFAFWVYKTWSKNAAYETNVVDVGYDCSSYPCSTEKLLSETCLTYKEFINANTGNSICTYVSGSGMGYETYSQKLYEVYWDACANKLNQLINQYSIEVPEKYKKCCDDISELIFMGEVNHSDDPDLYDVSDSILLRFGFLGIEVHPYQCEIFGVEDGDYIFGEPTEFSELTLQDFKMMVVE